MFFTRCYWKLAERNSQKLVFLKLAAENRFGFVITKPISHRLGLKLPHFKQVVHLKKVIRETLGDLICGFIY